MDSDCYVQPKPQLIDLSGQLNYWSELLRKKAKVKAVILTAAKYISYFQTLVKVTELIITVFRNMENEVKTLRWNQFGKFW